MSDFQVGDLVECVDAVPWRFPALLVHGEIYTVSAIIFAGHLSGYGVHVGGADQPWDRTTPAYSPTRFRLVYRPKADLITRLLEKPVKAPEVVS